jgi:hypothetical protein
MYFAKQSIDQLAALKVSAFLCRAATFSTAVRLVASAAQQQTERKVANFVAVAQEGLA